MPSYPSAQNEQLLHASAQSSRVHEVVDEELTAAGEEVGERFLPVGPSKTYDFSTRSQGSARRSARDRVACAGQVLLARHELAARGQPLRSRDDSMCVGHGPSYSKPAAPVYAGAHEAPHDQPGFGLRDAPAGRVCEHRELRRSPRRFSPRPNSGFLENADRMAPHPERAPFDRMWWAPDFDWSHYAKMYVAEVDTHHVLDMSIWEQINIRSIDVKKDIGDIATRIPRRVEKAFRTTRRTTSRSSKTPRRSTTRRS